MKTHDAIVQRFDRISLEDSKEVKLQNRIDSKYILNSEQLIVFLNAVTDKYKVVDIGNTQICTYKTVYFDTENAYLFQCHQRGFLNRCKIRFREYVDSNICFLEVKKKEKGRTIKVRKPVTFIPDQLEEEHYAFIASETSLKDEQIVPSLTNSYHRITLISNQKDERITIDSNLIYHQNSHEQHMENLVIIELKQDHVNHSSAAFLALKKMHIRMQKISKYCIGMTLLNDSLKYNTFKSKILAIDKITSNDLITSIGR